MKYLAFLLGIPMYVVGSFFVILASTSVEAFVYGFFGCFLLLYVSMALD